MRKVLCLLLIIPLIVFSSGCEPKNNQSEAVGQELTIATMPSPPKCKTTKNVGIIDSVLRVMAEIEKEPADDNTNGWYYFIELDVDGQSFKYSLGNIFTDSDGKQYKVLNYVEIKAKLTEIYEKIDEPERDYP